eukprot:GHVU01051668.1.p1 GENE.GHVU01051668.1~~GHVU01051668.1.p1  ORF type:complete len:182 (+),score=7.93 GHVU01051668.1:282-827(+)
MSTILKMLCEQEEMETNRDGKDCVIVFDGPLDFAWMDALNTVLDESHTLTLASGYRVNVPDNVSVICECDTMEMASPGTVSRLGVVWFPDDAIGKRRITCCTGYHSSQRHFRISILRYACALSTGWKTIANTFSRSQESLEGKQEMLNSLFARYMERLKDVRRTEQRPLLTQLMIEDSRSG